MPQLDRADCLSYSGRLPIVVFGGATMLLSGYLITRLVEIVAHLDDLAHSVDADLPEPPDRALDLTLATLFEIAVARDGPKAMMHALSRAERITRFPRAFQAKPAGIPLPATSP